MSVLLPAGWVFIEDALAAWLKRQPPELGGGADAHPVGIWIPDVVAIPIPGRRGHPTQAARDTVRRALADGLLAAAVLYDDGTTAPLPAAFWRGTEGANAMWPGERVAAPSRGPTVVPLPGGVPWIVGAPKGRVIVDSAALLRWLDAGAPASAEPAAAAGGARLSPRLLPSLSTRARDLIAVQEEAVRKTGHPLKQGEAQQKADPDGPKGRWERAWKEVGGARPDLIGPKRRWRRK